MSQGRRLDFTQEYFDPMCLNLSRFAAGARRGGFQRRAFAVAPLTLNDNGGNCGYTLPVQIRQAAEQARPIMTGCKAKPQREISSGFKTY